MPARTKTQEKTRVVVRTRTDCRMCGGTNLTKVWSFGETPLANNYLTPKEVAAKKFEPTAPLDIYACTDCHLVQMCDVVDPKVLFGNYLYVSSTSPAFVKHFEDYAKTLVDRFGLTAHDLVVDVGSNDGVLLKPLQALGVKTLGIEPAANIAQQANAEGIETVADFFTPHLAGRLREQYGPAKVISANNVFAHTDGVDTFVEAVQRLLADDGVFVFEVQYLRDLLEKNLFDIVYHEHVCYYHVHPLVEFFRRYDMEVFDVERPTVHGGSIRVYVSRKAADGHGTSQRTKRLQQVLRDEEEAGLNTLKPYKEFAARMKKNKQKLQTLLHDLKKQGKKIVGYGAPAKATTLMYAFGIDGSLIDYIVDDSPLKQGRLMPGTHVAIREPHFAKASPGRPDYFIILAWNFAEPIMHSNAWFAEGGGKWIVPVPEPRVV